MKSFLTGKIARTTLAVVLLVAVFVGGIFVGEARIPAIEKVTSLYNKQPASVAAAANVDFEPFWKVWNLINEKYVDPDKLNDQQKVWGAIEGLASSLDDPYTVFMPPKEAESFASEIKGNFEGVGMEVGIKDDSLTVVSPLKGSPAEKAGVRAGDKIVKINGEVSATMKTEEAVTKIRGKKGTPVVLTLAREGKGQPFDITIVRDVINIPTLDTDFKDGVFIIKLYNFSEPSPRAFRVALKEFIDSGSDKLILDLRGNPGGYLDASVDMASWFLPKDAVIVREDFGPKAPEEVQRSKGYNIFTEHLKMVILVNGGSASASEIVAGALREHNVATIVGTKTFGKGSVQELVKVTPDTSLKITIARWLTPKGVSISEKGITPDVEVKMSAEDVEKGRDPQMAKAMEILLNKK